MGSIQVIKNAKLCINGDILNHEKDHEKLNYIPDHAVSMTIKMDLFQQAAMRRELFKGFVPWYRSFIEDCALFEMGLV